MRRLRKSFLLIDERFVLNLLCCPSISTSPQELGGKCSFHTSRVKTRGSFLIYVPSSFVLAVNTKPCTIKLHRVGLLGDLAELGVLVNLKENSCVSVLTFKLTILHSSGHTVESHGRHMKRIAKMMSRCLALQK